MALQSSFYPVDGSTRTYPQSKFIASKQHADVYIRDFGTNDWNIIDKTEWVLVNNSVVLDVAIDADDYDQIEIRVADTADELADSMSDIAVVASLAEQIEAIASEPLKSAVEEIGSEPLKTAVLNAESNATSAASSASDAATSESNAASSASAAATSESNASTSESNASTSESNATTSASTAQLKAWEAHAEYLTSASYADEAEDTPVNIYTSNGDGTFTATPTSPAEYSSYHWKKKAESVASGVNPELELGTMTHAIRNDDSWMLYNASTTGAISLKLNGIFSSGISMIGKMIIQLESVSFSATLIIDGTFSGSSNHWYNGRAIMISDSSTPLNVRFCTHPSGSYASILIGDTDTIWSGMRVVVTEALYNNSSTFTGFEIGMVSSYPTVTDFTVPTTVFGRLASANSWAGEQTFKETKETVYEMTGTDINPANGGMPHKVMQSAETLTESLENGQSVVLSLADADINTPTFPPIVWSTSSGNVEPTWTASDTIVLWKRSNVLWGAYQGSSGYESFVMEFTTTGASESITIPCQDVGTFDAVINWGDGSSSTITAYDDADLTHTYATADTYEVRISGIFPNIYFNNTGTTKDKLVSVKNLGLVGWEALRNSFLGCDNILEFTIGVTDTSDVIYTDFMFGNLVSLTTLDVTNLNSGNVNDVSYMFWNLSGLTSPVLGLDTWDIRNVTNALGFMTGISAAGFTTTEYDAFILNCYSQSTTGGGTGVQSGVTWDMGSYVTSTTSGAVATAKASLIANDSWVFNDAN